MRTQKQIVNKIESIKEKDFFGFQTNDLLGFLDYEHAKPYIKPETTREEWDESKSPNTEKAIKRIMKEYMPFAWDKANGCRGLSAGRSMAHYSAWVWLLGDEDNFGDLEEYQFYGKDNLVKLCKYYGWDHTQWDDGIRTNGET